ncbi:hypothetical protein HK097_005009, partial [Rhizophlyctis rosea]
MWIEVLTPGPNGDPQPVSVLSFDIGYSNPFKGPDALAARPLPLNGRRAGPRTAQEAVVMASLRNAAHTDPAIWRCSITKHVAFDLSQRNIVCTLTDETLITLPMARKCESALKHSLQSLQTIQTLAQTSKHQSAPSSPTSPSAPTQTLTRKGSILSFFGLLPSPTNEFEHFESHGQALAIELQSIQPQKITPPTTTDASRIASNTLVRVKSHVSDLFRRYALQGGLSSALSESYTEWLAQSKLKAAEKQLEELNQTLERQSTLINNYARALSALRQAFCQYLEGSGSETEVDEPSDSSCPAENTAKVPESPLHASLRTMPAVTQLPTPFIHAILAGLKLDMLESTTLITTPTLSHADSPTSPTHPRKALDLFRLSPSPLPSPSRDLTHWQGPLESVLKERNEPLVPSLSSGVDWLHKSVAERFYEALGRGCGVDEAFGEVEGDIGFVEVYLGLFGGWGRKVEERNKTRCGKLETLEERERARQHLITIEQDRADAQKREQEALAEKRKRVAASMRALEIMVPPPPPPRKIEPPKPPPSAPTVSSQPSSPTTPTTTPPEYSEKPIVVTNSTDTDKTPKLKRKSIPTFLTHQPPGQMNLWLLRDLPSNSPLRNNHSLRRASTGNLSRSSGGIGSLGLLKHARDDDDDDEGNEDEERGEEKREGTRRGGDVISVTSPIARKTRQRVR